MARKQSEKEKAMQATAQRTELERRAVEKLHQLITETFEQIAMLGYEQHLQDEFLRFSSIKNKRLLQHYLEQLRRLLYSIIENYAQMATEVVRRFFPFIEEITIADILNRESHGKTAKQRIAIYTQRLKMEMEAWIAAAVSIGVDMATLVQTFNAQSRNPYSNPIFSAAMKRLRNSGETAAASRLRTGGVSYGTGIYVSAEASLNRLARYLVADSFRLAQFLAFGSTPGIKGYIVGRGSSYPCDLCDSMAGFHPLGYEELPPYHANCCCWAMPAT